MEFYRTCTPGPVLPLTDSRSEIGVPANLLHSNESFPASKKPQPYNQNYSLTQPSNILGKSYVRKDGSSFLLSQKINSLGATPSPTDRAGIAAKTSRQAKILQDTVRGFFLSLNDTGLSTNEEKMAEHSTRQNKLMFL